MRIAVVYNREGKSVINLFGMPNREKNEFVGVADPRRDGAAGGPRK